MEIFGRHGGVVQCRMFGNQGFRTSAALVRMHSVEAASKIIQALNGYFPVHRHGFGKPVGLVIRFADSPQEKAVRRLRQNKTNLMVQERWVYYFLHLQSVTLPVCIIVACMYHDG